MITGRDLIEKLYSEYEEEERTYSVEMDEETLSLFSDFCEEYGIDLYQKSFALSPVVSSLRNNLIKNPAAQQKVVGKLMTPMKKKLPTSLSYTGETFNMKRGPLTIGAQLGKGPIKKLSPASRIERVDLGNGKMQVRPRK